MKDGTPIDAISLDYEMGTGYSTGMDVLKWIKDEVQRNPSFTPPARMRVHTKSWEMERNMVEMIEEITSLVVARGPRR